MPSKRAFRRFLLKPAVKHRGRVLAKRRIIDISFNYQKGLLSRTANM